MIRGNEGVCVRTDCRFVHKRGHLPRATASTPLPECKGYTLRTKKNKETICISTVKRTCYRPIIWVKRKKYLCSGLKQILRFRLLDSNEIRVNAFYLCILSSFTHTLDISNLCDFLLHIT